MDNDDKTIGRILSRRELLIALGATGTASVAAFLVGRTGQAQDDLSKKIYLPMVSGGPTQTPTATVSTTPASTPTATVSTTPASTSTAIPRCVVQPEVTEGPYYVDVDLIRQDITEGLAGIPLALTFNVVQVSNNGCVPMENVLIEIWHCNKDGQYSGVRDPGFNTTGQTWLRGAQKTDANGVVTFNTIFPGWYSSRCIHIHFKAFPTENQLFTSQLFFPDQFNNQIVTQQPYTKGVPDTTNLTDNIYRETLLATATESTDGVTANFALGIVA